MIDFAKRWWKTGLKVALAGAILAFVGRQFYRDLASLEKHDLGWHVEWLVVSALLYLVALSFSAWYWHRLLRVFGQDVSYLDAGRGYFISQIGKYVPGKAVALLMRVALVRGPNCSVGVAIVTSVYEVLTTMAAGALVSAIIFAIHPPVIEGLRLPPYLWGIILLGMCGIPLLPGVFNFLVRRTARKFSTIEALQLPKIRLATLVEGLLMTAVGWGVMGLSVWAGINAVLAEPLSLTLQTWTQFCAIIGLAYVFGFLAVIMPGGVGVREGLLLKLLTPHGPVASIALGVLLLRLAWTIAEFPLAGVLYYVGRSDAKSEISARFVQTDEIAGPASDGKHP